MIVHVCSKKASCIIHPLCDDITRTNQFTVFGVTFCNTLSFSPAHVDNATAKAKTSLCDLKPSKLVNKNENLN